MNIIAKIIKFVKINKSKNITIVYYKCKAYNHHHHQQGLFCCAHDIPICKGCGKFVCRMHINKYKNICGFCTKEKAENIMHFGNIAQLGCICSHRIICYKCGKLICINSEKIKKSIIKYGCLYFDWKYVCENC